MKSIRLAAIVAALLVGASLGGPGVANLVGDEETTEVVQQQDTDETQQNESAEEEQAEEQEAQTEDNGEADAHGTAVSTVAKCAPRGNDSRFGSLDQRNHGAFASAVARGQSVTVGGTVYDLSTPEGVAALCAALDAIPQAEQTDVSDAEDATTTTARGKGHAKGKARGHNA